MPRCKGNIATNWRAVASSSSVTVSLVCAATTVEHGRRSSGYRTSASSHCAGPAVKPFELSAERGNLLLLFGLLQGVFGAVGAIRGVRNLSCRAMRPRHGHFWFGWDARTCFSMAPGSNSVVAPFHFSRHRLRPPAAALTSPSLRAPFSPSQSRCRVPYPCSGSSRV